MSRSYDIPWFKVVFLSLAYVNGTVWLSALAHVCWWLLCVVCLFTWCKEWWMGNYFGCLCHAVDYWEKHTDLYKHTHMCTLLTLCNVESKKHSILEKQNLREVLSQFQFSCPLCPHPCLNFCSYQVPACCTVLLTVHTIHNSFDLSLRLLPLFWLWTLL